MALPAPARRLLVVVVVATAVSGCTGGDDPLTEVAAAVATPTEVAAPAPSPTPVPTATVAPTPTTAPTPEPTLGPVERAQADLEEIKAVHTRFMTELFARDERDPESVERHLELSRELTADGQLEEMLQGPARRSADGKYIVSDGAISNIGDIQIYEDGQVEVFDCSKDLGSWFDDDGQLSEPAAEFEWRATYLRIQEDGQWRVVRFNSIIDESCTPPS